MAPTRAKINEMVASAKVLAASTAPKGCDSPKLKEAAAGLVGHTQGVADMVAKKADDVALKAAMKALHDKFDVLEEGCVMPKAGKQ
jgi:malonyl CoA-acyl carrier protein transacylase